MNKLKKVYDILNREIKKNYIVAIADSQNSKLYVSKVIDIDKFGTITYKIFLNKVEKDQLSIEDLFNPNLGSTFYKCKTPSSRLIILKKTDK